MKLIKILAIVIVFGAIVYGAALFGTRHAVADTEAFLNAGFEERFEDAFGAMTEEGRRAASPSQLAYLFYRHGLTGASTVSWSSRAVSGDQGLLEGTITNSAGAESGWQINLRHDGEQWRVNGIAPSTPAPALQPPPFEAVSNLVNDTMGRFVEALESRDFEPFLAASSKTWQLQTSADVLATNFLTMHDQNPAIPGIMESSTAAGIAPPSIDPQGLMTVEGNVGDPPQLLFQQVYFREKGDWKLFGISVQQTAPAATPAATGEEPGNAEESAAEPAG